MLGRGRLCPGGVWAEQTGLVDPGSPGLCSQQRFPDFPGSCAGLIEGVEVELRREKQGRG